MKDLTQLMQQAQAMQQKLQDAQAKMAETAAELIVAAHADAKRKLDEANAVLMREAAGPMAGMNIPGMPKLF